MTYHNITKIGQATVNSVSVVTLADGKYRHICQRSISAFVKKYS